MAISDYNRAKRSRIETFCYLDAILRYDAISGELTWKTLFPGRIAGAIVTGKNARTSYRKLALEKLDFKAHRICWILAYGRLPNPGMVIDHIDGNGMNNALSNLRECMQSMNSRNSQKPKTNTSGFKGVRSVTGSTKYQAYICVNRKQIHLGMHKTKEQAYQAYCEAAKTHFGEYACIDK